MPTNAKDKAATARARATELAEKSAKLNPQDALAQAKLASFYAQQNLREKAMTRIQTALALSPDDPAILSDVATSFEYLGDRRQAIQYATSYTKRLSVRAIGQRPRYAELDSRSQSPAQG